MTRRIIYFVTVLFLAVPLSAADTSQIGKSLSKKTSVEIPKAIPDKAWIFRELKGIVVIEVESYSPRGSWKPEKQMEGFTGEGYYTWRGGNKYNTGGKGILSYPVLIETEGTYNLRIRNRHDFHDSTEENDCWTRMDKGKWVKTFSGQRGKWTWASNHEHDHKTKPPASYELKSGIHLLQISGRSKNFSIDRVHLYRKDIKNALDPELPETRVKAAVLRKAGIGQETAEKTFKFNSGVSEKAVVSGELKKWHRVTIAFNGPPASESGDPNPFMDARLDVTFTLKDKKITVPGYYAADGNAGITGNEKGNKWKVHFAPPAEGKWSWKASFRTGKDVAVAGLDSGSSAAFDGKSGTLDIGSTDKKGRDLRGKGLLGYVGKRYLRFAETGEYFLKGGADSPENLLGYREFDSTFRLGGGDLHHYRPHVSDWKNGDPVWGDGKGKGLIGAINYLSSVGMNSVYFIPYNIDGGDGKDVWPWTGPEEKLRFDCSKLDQWEIVFSHMTKMGITMHMITQEQENDQGLDRGNLGNRRKLYYRELIARFAHHPGLVWNLGEENTNTDSQRKAFCRYIRQIDPWDHPIVCHTFPGKYEKVYGPLLGSKYFEGPSLQMGDMRQTHSETLKWIDASEKAGRPWFVCLDEIGPAHTGVKPDKDNPDHRDVRHHCLWGNLMAGGAGVEWYFGYKFAHNDLNCEDWRSRATMWIQTRIALDFFREYLPFHEMVSADNLTSDKNDYCFAKKGGIYAVYLPEGKMTNLELPAGEFTIKWFNPRVGGKLMEGSVKKVNGPGVRSLGTPPAETGKDWVVLARKDD